MCRGVDHVHPDARQAVIDLMFDLCRALDPEHPERVRIGPVDFGPEKEHG